MNLPEQVERAVREVAESLKLSPYLLLMKHQTAPVVEARRRVFQRLRREGYTTTWIGRWFDCHHATVLYHCNGGRERQRKTLVKRRNLTRDTAGRGGPPRPGSSSRPPGPPEVMDFCDRCGIRLPVAAMRYEPYHYVCRDVAACERRYRHYLEFRAELARQIATAP